MVKALKSLVDAGKEISEAELGSVLQLWGNEDIWDYFFANENSFQIGYKTEDKNCVILKHPGGELYTEKVLRLIPHPDGPIIMDFDENLTQNEKPFFHQSGIPGFHSIPSISRDTNGLTVNSPNGSPCVNLTALVPALTDYDHIEQHKRGLLVSRGNCVWLVVTEPVKTGVTAN